jgi:hypothetical protein
LDIGERRRPLAHAVDTLTENEISTAGLFYAMPRHVLDVDETRAAPERRTARISLSRLRVYKPYGNGLQAIVSFMAEHKGDGAVSRPSGPRSRLR